MLRNLISRLAPTSRVSKSNKRDSKAIRSRRRSLKVESLESRITFDASFGGFEEFSRFHITDFEVDKDGNTLRVGRYFVSADSPTVDIDPNNVSPTGADILSPPDGREGFGFVAKFSQDGALAWVHNIDISLAELTVDTSGNVFVVGSFYGTLSFGEVVATSAGSGDAIAFKFSPDGAMLWSQSFSKTTNLEWPTDIDTDSSGNVYVALYTTPAETHSIVRLNANGSFAWQRTLYTNNYFQMQLEVTSNNEIVIAGDFTGRVDMDPSWRTRWVSSGSGRSVFVSRFSASGNLLWNGAFVGRTYNNAISSSSVTGLELDSSNNILVTGRYAGQVDVDPSSRVTNLPIDRMHNTNSLADDMFAVKLAPNGALLWARGWQSPEGMGFSRTAADIDKFGNLYITGHLLVGPGQTWSVDLDPTAGVSQHALSLSTTFVLRINSSGAFAWSRTIGITEDNDGSVGRGNADALTFIAIGPNSEMYFAFGVDSAMADLDPNPNSQSILASTAERIRRRGIVRWNQI